jgi:hypothetical protein
MPAGTSQLHRGSAQARRGERERYTVWVLVVRASRASARARHPRRARLRRPVRAARATSCGSLSRDGAPVRASVVPVACGCVGVPAVWPPCVTTGGRDAVLCKPRVAARRPDWQATTKGEGFWGLWLTEGLADGRLPDAGQA